MRGKPYRVNETGGDGSIFLIKGMIRADPGNDSALMQMLDTYGPVAVAIDGSSPGFQNFKGGIFNGPCRQDKISIRLKW